MENSNIIESKETALAQITQLAQEFDVSLDEIGARFTQKNNQDKSDKWLSRLLGYLGGAFVFGGLALLISMLWDDLSSVARVIITYGPGLVTFILSIIVLKDPRYDKASTPLFLMSAILLPTGMFVFLHEYAKGDDGQLAAMIVFGILACHFLGAFFPLKRTSLLFFGYLFWNGSIGILMERAGVSGEILGIILGVSIMMVAWSIDQTKHRAIAPFWYFLGSIGLLWSIFDLIEGISPIDILYLPLTIFLMLVSTRIHSRTLLFISTLALLGFLGYYTGEYFADTTGWPIALIIMGFMLISVSAYAVQLGKKIK
ncbi:hypothetical protein AB835_07755 [Candidatus Endobugula sertula]|uniref:DUF2157 domain-containing protein n=1 Tax=Candidatus Endobugula sertula TaxID=62101 RepID=A0A1D2QQ30_9GAMM|nr:hypothetical protein AB835_07755 [Candidatus Endobugula sertula]